MCVSVTSTSESDSDTDRRTVTAANCFVCPSESVNWNETPDPRVVEKS